MLTPLIPYLDGTVARDGVGHGGLDSMGAAPSGPSFKKEWKNWSTVSELPRPVR